MEGKTGDFTDSSGGNELPKFGFSLQMTAESATEFLSLLWKEHRDGTHSARFALSD